ncbi:MAG: hypothetical protein WBK95_05525 [Sulfurimonas sp.]
MKKVTMIIVFIMSIFILNGCAGKNFTWNDASTIKVGDTGEQVIEKMKGKPYMITASKVDGKIVEKYIWSFANGMTGSSKAVTFILTDNKVTSIPTITESLKNQ